MLYECTRCGTSDLSTVQARVVADSGVSSSDLQHLSSVVVCAGHHGPPQHDTAQGTHAHYCWHAHHRPRFGLRLQLRLRHEPCPRPVTSHLHRLGGLGSGAFQVTKQLPSWQ